MRVGDCGHLAGVLVSAVDVWVMWAVVTPGVDVERVGRIHGIEMNEWTLR